MGSTCVQDEFGGNMPWMSTDIIILIVCSGVLLCVRFYVYYVENIDRLPISGVSHRLSYGFGAKGVAKSLSSLGLAFSLPPLILFFVMRSENHSNASEFACQSQSGFVFMPPLLLGYFSLVLFATNFMRYFTRHSFATVIMDYIRAVSADDTTTRIAILPAYRGIWFSPIIQQYLAKTNSVDTNTQSQCEFVAFDCYNSIYNPESADWLTSNMQLEGIPMNQLRIIWTTFKHIDLPEDSIDSLVIPIGMLISYLSLSFGTPGEESKEVKHSRTVQFFTELKRVLKPGGTLIASNLSFYHKDWVKALNECGLVDITILSEKVWWSYLPAVVTVAYKPKETTNQTNSLILTSGNNSLNNYSSVNNTIKSPLLHSSNSSVNYNNSNNNSTDGDRCNSNNTFSISTFEVTAAVAEGAKAKHATTATHNNEYARSLNNTLCPAGANFRLVEFLLLFTLAFYIGFIVLTVTQLDKLQVPTMMPYGQMLSALFINNCLFIPIAMFSMVGELRVAASTSLTTTSKSTSTVSAEDIEEFNRKQRTVILRIFRNHLVNILIVVTLVSVLGWAPYAALDYVLIEYAHQSEKVVSNVNIGVSICVVAVLIPTAQALYKWYAKRDYLQNKEIKALKTSAAAVAVTSNSASSNYDANNEDV